MLLTDARRAARSGPEGELIPLTEQVQGPAAGLKLLEALDGDERLAGHSRLDAVRAHLLEMAGDHEAAIAGYLAAAGRTASIPERDYLTAKAARLASDRR